MQLRASEPVHLTQVAYPNSLSWSASPIAVSRSTLPQSLMAETARLTPSDSSKSNPKHRWDERAGGRALLEQVIDWNHSYEVHGIVERGAKRNSPSVQLRGALLRVESGSHTRRVARFR